MDGNLRAVVIDDDNDTVVFFAEYLEIKGVNVFGRGNNGNEACNLYLKLKPDIIFLDVVMPRYDGFYALSEIKKMDRDAKVIMVTADFTAKTRERLKKLQASAVIFKPFDMGRVMELVYRLCSARTLGAMLIQKD